MPADARPLRYEPDLPGLDSLEAAYEFLSELGRGGMAAVHLARRRSTGELVAVKGICKRFADDEDCVQRFEREARTLATLEHPNIVRTLAVESFDSRTLAIVMEYLQGHTLREALRSGGPMSFDRARTILRDIAEALEYAHARGYVHRDVKPDNIFLEADTGRARLADFGIARRLEGDVDLTIAGMAFGTPAYMSPEQVDGGELDARSDIYSLGVLGWELLAGQRPWAGENLYGILYRQKHDDLPSLERLRPDVPASLLHAIEGAMQKRTGARWGNARAFIDALLGRQQSIAAPARHGASIAAHLGDPATLRFRRERDDPELVQGPDAPGDDQLNDDATEPELWSPRREAPWRPSEPFMPADAPWDLPVLGAEGSPHGARPDRPPVYSLALVLLVMYILFAAISERRELAADTRGTLAMASLDGSGGFGGDPRTLGYERGDGEVRALTTLRSHHDSLAACERPTRASQRACVAALVGPADSRVDRSFGTLLDVHRARSVAAADTNEAPTLRRLRVQHRAWRIERNIECEMRYAEAEGERWAEPRARCLTAITDERMRELTAELRASGGRR
jgi:serine/threonine protein kinase/uncharacterized protein YecT (DUF1311 family)